MSGIPRCVTEAFYRVCSLEGSGGTPPVWARGEVLWQKKGFRAFQRAKMSPQDTQLNTFATFSSKLKLNTVNPVLSGHSKRRPKLGFQNQILLNAGQKYCRMFQREHSAMLLVICHEDHLFFLFSFYFYYFFYYFWVAASDRFYCNEIPVLAASSCTHMRMFAYT